MERLTVIISNGSTYNAAKFIKSRTFELNNLRCNMQISSFNPLAYALVTVRLKINFGME